MFMFSFKIWGSPSKYLRKKIVKLNMGCLWKGCKNRFRSVLEVGWYATVWHTGTSRGLEFPYRHLFQKKKPYRDAKNAPCVFVLSKIKILIQHIIAFKSAK